MSIIKKSLRYLYSKFINYIEPENKKENIKEIVNNDEVNSNNYDNKKQNMEKNSNYINVNDLNNDENNTEIENIDNIYNMKKIWEITKIKENTQAEHILSVITYDDWMCMEDIKSKIKEKFNVDYKNEKSLYPYLKTLTDINLVKLNNSGKKRTWRKSNTVILVKKDIE